MRRTFLALGGASGSFLGSAWRARRERSWLSRSGASAALPGILTVVGPVQGGRAAVGPGGEARGHQGTIKRGLPRGDLGAPGLVLAPGLVQRRLAGHLPTLPGHQGRAPLHPRSARRFHAGGGPVWDRVREGLAVAEGLHGPSARGRAGTGHLAHSPRTEAAGGWASRARGPATGTRGGPRDHRRAVGVSRGHEHPRGGTPGPHTRRGEGV